MLNLDTLRSFTAVAQCGSFSRAADLLGISQPTISEHIRSLESRLGTSLLVRGHRKSELTPAGGKVLATARRIIELSDSLLQTGQTTALRLGISSNILVYYLAKHLNGLRELGAIVQTKSNPELAQGLRSGMLDAAILEWPLGETGFEAIDLFTDPLVLILHPDHPLAQSDAITLKQLKTLPLLGGEPGTGTFTLLKNALGTHANDLNISWTLGSTEAVKQAVKGNVGASIVLAGSVQNEIANSTLASTVVKGLSLKKTFYLCAPSSTLRDQKLPELLQTLKRSFDQ